VEYRPSYRSSSSGRTVQRLEACLSSNIGAVGADMSCPSLDVLRKPSRGLPRSILYVVQRLELLIVPYKVVVRLL
jgi:hypothetical protein